MEDLKDGTCFVKVFSRGVPCIAACVPGTPWLSWRSRGCGVYFLAQGKISGKRWLCLLHPDRFLTPIYKSLRLYVSA